MDKSDQEYRVLCAYNIIVIIALEVGLNNHPDVVQALRFLCGESDEDPMPFPKTKPLSDSWLGRSN